MRKRERAGEPLCGSGKWGHNCAAATRLANTITRIQRRISGSWAVRPDRRRREKASIGPPDCLGAALPCPFARFLLSATADKFWSAVILLRSGISNHSLASSSTPSLVDTATMSTSSYKSEDQEKATPSSVVTPVDTPGVNQHTGILGQVGQSTTLTAQGSRELTSRRRADVESRLVGRQVRRGSPVSHRIAPSNIS